MINDELKSEIESYCKLNDITDVKGLVDKMLKRGFSIEKFGDVALGGEVVEKIVEKRVEVPVEKIVRVEVPVEKIVNVTDDTKINDLVLKIEKTNKANGDKILELDDVILKKNNELLELKKAHSTEVKDLKDQVSGLTEELDKVKEEKTDKKDIYDQPVGFWGSNIKNIFNGNKGKGK